jgi:hypothetical protein
MARQEALGRVSMNSKRALAQAARNPRLGLSVMVNKTWYYLGASTMVDDEWEVGPRASRFSLRAFLIRDWPYLAMLALALFGVAYTSIARQSMTHYWIVLAPFYADFDLLERTTQISENFLLPLKLFGRAPVNEGRLNVNPSHNADNAAVREQR